MLVNALWAVGQMVVGPGMSRRAKKERDVAGWMDTETLIRDGLPGATLELPGLSEAEAAEFEAALKRPEVQGALQALLAARLTDAPETDAAQAREAVRLALQPATRYAGEVSEYYDEKISVLVGHLEGSAGLAALSQIRSEAYSSRIVALLGAIERQLAALADPGRGGREETDFLERYRSQAKYRHGNLEPPDFERRRKVPATKIYVNTAVFEYRDQPASVGGKPAAGGTDEAQLRVLDLPPLLDRTVLLGDPGGGKTTAANVLANFFASDATGKVPFLVTLREYAAMTPPERSVAGHIEHTLETLYQRRPPAGLVERLLLTGRAVVIFDGLDELLDTSRRREVSERVEQFCSAYPLTPVLVTSRLVGYDQARLDDSQFASYRLGEFGDAEVTDYVRKWFATQEGAAPAAAQAEAEAFLTESASATDLRSNPLLLSLMCILYRGAGSLPHDRAGVYAKCAELLFNKWDEQRRIRRELRAAAYVEPAIQYLAWWMFTSADSRASVAESRLIEEAAAFLLGRAFESATEARAAAIEFVEFSRGRLWVLSDAGSTADGEKLYAFTHRTFLEYFAAAHLAAVSDTPEELARALAPRVPAAEWQVVGQLAVQVKERNTDRGADRIYAALLEPGPESADRGRLLVFLARSLDGTRVSPATVRALTRAALDPYPGGDQTEVKFYPLSLLLGHGAGHEELIADELAGRISVMVASDDPATRADGLQLGLGARWAGQSAFWTQWSAEHADRYAAAIAAEAARSPSLRTVALNMHVISLEQALDMPGGLGALMAMAHATLSEIAATIPYPLALTTQLQFSTAPDKDMARAFALIGRHLLGRPSPPWLTHPGYQGLPFFPDPAAVARIPAWLLDEAGWLGLTTVICGYAELSEGPVWGAFGMGGTFGMGGVVPWMWGSSVMGGFYGMPALQDPRHATSQSIERYIMSRRMRLLPQAITSELPDLPVPARFRPLFKDWAAGRVNFVESARE